MTGEDREVTSVNTFVMNGSWLYSLGGKEKARVNFSEYFKPHNPLGATPPWSRQWSTPIPPSGNTINA